MNILHLLIYYPTDNIWTVSRLAILTKTPKNILVQKNHKKTKKHKKPEHTSKALMGCCCRWRGDHTWRGAARKVCQQCLRFPYLETVLEDLRQVAENGLTPCPGRLSWLGVIPQCEGRQFHSRAGRGLGCGLQPPVGARMRGYNRSRFPSHMDVSLPLFFSPFPFL